MFHHISWCLYQFVRFLFLFHHLPLAFSKKWFLFLKINIRWINHICKNLLFPGILYYLYLFFYCNTLYNTALFCINLSKLKNVFQQAFSFGRITKKINKSIAVILSSTVSIRSDFTVPMISLIHDHCIGHKHGAMMRKQPSKVFSKKVLLKNLQYSHENTCDRVSF